jgi:hypothetical protein
MRPGWLWLALLGGGLTGLQACGGGDTPSASQAVDAGADIDAGWDIQHDIQKPKPDATDIVLVPDVPKEDVGLPLPATVPDDLPDGVVAVPVWGGPLNPQGSSGEQKVKLPDHTVGWLTVVKGPQVDKNQQPGWFSLGVVVGPDGVPYANGACNGASAVAGGVCLTCKNRQDAAQAVGSVLLPSSSGVKAQSGPWRLTSCGYTWQQSGNLYAPKPFAGAQVDTVLFAKTTADGALPAGGRIALRLFLTGAGGLTAANALADPRIQQMVAAANARYATLGIQLDVIAAADVPPGHTLIALPEGLTATSDDLDALFATAAPAGGSGVVDVFVVEQILGGEVEGKGIVAGVAGAIPGPAFYHGVPRSGIALTVGAMGDGAMAGKTLAHELGHFLGLWHPTERDGKRFDPLDDTPECPLGKDANQDGVVDVAECAGLGADLVMFWFAGPSDGGFSPQQQAVLLGHPLVLPVAATSSQMP